MEKCAKAVFIIVIRLYNLHTAQLHTKPARLPRAAVTDLSVAAKYSCQFARQLASVLPFSRSRVAVVMHECSPTRSAGSGGLGIGKGEANGAARVGERGEITPRTYMIPCGLIFDPATVKHCNL